MWDQRLAYVSPKSELHVLPPAGKAQVGDHSPLLSIGYCGNLHADMPKCMLPQPAYRGQSFLMEYADRAASGCGSRWSNCRSGQREAQSPPKPPVPALGLLCEAGEQLHHASCYVPCMSATFEPSTSCLESLHVNSGASVQALSLMK